MTEQPNTAPPAEQHAGASAPPVALYRPAVAVPLSEQVKCVQREIRLRQVVYPKLIARGKMTQATADKEMQAMQAVLATLQKLAAIQPKLAALRAGGTHEPEAGKETPHE